ncbi:short-subunit dehydrogenase [Halanaerobium saccharolyticum]|uniref:Short-subunit dehydrogenase n=1 Tax=Halanaerobium saccharolyticum TaxID=43595 RepID=A0A4R7YPP5_9FIRM|nr:oxidoreductase [Halanaerobium saccharolyticum]RAK05039.1 short-subunit dehydrogenase [Halanaerobium saccharolyticum]TDV98825.1 short-subunit dehydrogenase [Halanaerobium saccharolyticum]TDX51476.1 short-subunit dehydrogenase [Halanaerobium saccharolyticum]
MNGKVVLITGASSGIGRSTAEKFLNKGYIVYGAARTEEKLKYLNEYPDGYYQIMDITEAEMRKNCVQEILAAHGKIDILINNAGYGAYGAIEEVPVEEARRQFEVNLFGLSELTKLVIPGMRENKSGKIINISSIAGKIWTPLGGWYHASKFALEGLSDCLRNELKDFGIKVILIEPGAIETNWAETAGENLLKTSGEGIYQKQAQRKASKYKIMYGEGGIAAQPEVVASAIIRAAEDSHPKARYAVPVHAKLILFFRWLLPDRVYDFVTNKFF